MLPANSHYFPKLHYPVGLCNDDVQRSWISSFKKSTKHLNISMICCHTEFKKPVIFVGNTAMMSVLERHRNTLAELT
jgi:hydrogenase maturation factor